MSALVGNPENRLSHVEAHTIMAIFSGKKVMDSWLNFPCTCNLQHKQSKLSAQLTVYGVLGIEGLEGA